MRDRGLSEHKVLLYKSLFLSQFCPQEYGKGLMFSFYNFDNAGAHKLKESFCGAKST